MICKNFLKLKIKFGLETVIIAVFVLAIFVSFAIPADAYSPGATHLPLGEKAVDLYNAHYPDNALTAQERGWVAQGSHDEDKPICRAFQHFYDPINNVGLEKYKASKIWVHDAALQSLARHQFRFNCAIDPASHNPGIHTWEEAIEAYKRGDKKTAYHNLGHVFHLIQDATVPAHTRQDPHPGHDDEHLQVGFYGGKDPLEVGAKTLAKNRMPSTGSMRPVLRDNLDAYFDGVAFYTNTNFLSKDSLGHYDKPDITRRDQNYAYANDGNGEYRLIRIYGGGFWDYENRDNIKVKLDDQAVLNDYWDRLAPTAIENTAGILKLFHDTVEEEIEKEKQQEKLSFWEKALNNTLAKVDNRVSKTKNWLENTYTFFDFLTARNQKDTSKLDLSILGKNLFDSGSDSTIYNSEGRNEFTNHLKQAPLDTPQPPQEENNQEENQNEQQSNTETEDTQQPNQNLHLVTRVIDGDTIELANGEKVRYVGVNAAENNNCYAEEATNYNKQLVLNKQVKLEPGPDDKDHFGRLLRYVWQGDTFVNKKLIETGHTYSHDFGFTHKYTDEFENIEQNAKDSELGLWAVCGKEKQDSVGGEPKQESAFGPNAPYGPIGPGSIKKPTENANNSPDLPDHLVINEIQTQDKEFVELFNPTSEMIDLSTHWFAYYSPSRDVWNDPWRIKQFSSDAQIAANSYFLIGLNDYNEDVDWSPYASAQLSNQQGTVAIFKGDPREQDNPQPIDAAAWGSDEDVTLKETKTAPNPAEGKSISRNQNHKDTDNNKDDFTEGEPTPQNSIQVVATGAPVWGSFQNNAQNNGLSAYTGPSSNPSSVWSQEIDRFATQPVVDAAGNIYVGDRNNLYSYTKVGKLRWKTDFGGTLALSNDGAYLYVLRCMRDDGCYLYVRSAQSGKLTNLQKVASEVSNGGPTTPLVDAETGNVYIVTRDSIFAFTKEGNLRWERRWNTGDDDIDTFIKIIGVSTPTIYQDNLYAIARGTQLRKAAVYVFNKNTGELNWARLLQGQSTEGSRSIRWTAGSPVMSNIGIFAIVTEHNGGSINVNKRGISVFDTGNLGEILWISDIASRKFYPKSLKAIDSENNFYYSAGNILKKADIEGEVSEVLDFSDDEQNINSVVVDKNDIIYVAAGDTLYALQDNTPLWNKQFEGEITQVVVGDNSLYVTTKTAEGSLALHLLK